MSVHPSINHPEVHTSDAVFAQAVAIVNRSRVVPMIEEWRAERVAAPRGPCRAALPYTVEAVLVAIACVLLRRAEPTIRTIFRTLLDFTPDQLAQLNIDTDDLTAIRANADRSLKSFRNWLDRALTCLDSMPDQPAVRILMARHHLIIRMRTPEQRNAYSIAAQRLSTVINRIVAGSIDDEYHRSGRGDVVVDETIIDTAAGTHDLGVSDDRHRSAIAFGGYYRRDYRNRVDANGRKLTKKSASGIGITAISSIGPPAALHSRPSLFTGIAIHPPTSGSLEGLDEAITHHQRNGFDSRPTSRTARLPLITFDMGT